MLKSRIPALTISIVLLCSSLGLAEMIVDTAWVRTFDGEGWLDYAKAIAVDGFGNVYVAGLTSDSTFSFDCATIKYYPSGEIAWLRTYDGPGGGWDVVCEVAVDDSSNVYMAGYSMDSTTDFDYVTVKYYPDGETAWIKRYDGPVSSSDHARSMAVDDSGCVYVTGHAQDTNSFSGPNSDYASIKYHPNGDTAWVRRYDGPAFYNDRAHALAVDDLGNLYVTGASHSREAFEDYATIKYLVNGDTAWVRRYDGPGYLRDEAFSIAVNGSGEVCVTGWSWNGTNYDYATIKYRADGDTAWVRRCDGPGHLLDSAAAVAVDELGNAYVTGSSWVTQTDCDYLTIKYRPNGEVAWIRRYDGPAGGVDHVSAMVTDDLGNVYVTGASRGVGVSDDYATVKYDSSGLRLWVRRHNGPDNGLDAASDITVDDDGNVYVTGTGRNGGSREDFVTVKYVQTGLWRGDTNLDGIVDLGDLVFLIGYLYRGGPAPDTLKVGDCNCDETVQLGDAIFLVNYLFRDGPPPDCWE